MPAAVSSFAHAGNYEKNKIQVLIINAGMINSPTMKQRFDRTLLNHHSIPFEALEATRPLMIIDEPHKFDKANKTWGNLQKIKPQFIIRYGATFKKNENLIYQLTAVDSFNKNLVKGVTGHITAFDTGQNALVKFTTSDGTEASFQLKAYKDKKESIKTFKLAKKESLEKVHPAMKDLYIDQLNKTTVMLSNGLALKKGDKISPYAYAETLQQTMIQKAIKHHFAQEKKYLSREVKIKPLTLFFIDNIASYRDEEGYIKKTVEKYITAEAKQLLETAQTAFYKKYLEKTLEDVSKTHAGYFAIDKKETDEIIEREVNEILHDKQAILSVDNPRRFIFSKWTLREGWDNPNIFQICKLRSSGSDISKLQEVGRGLRLPVNEYGNRVKDEQFYLHYFVDFTEDQFIETLVSEINEKSGAISRDDKPKKLTSEMIKQITAKRGLTEEELLEKLYKKNVIKMTHDFKEGGLAYIKKHYDPILKGLASNKIIKADAQKQQVSVRVEKYPELKALWEKLNEKVVLEYKIRNEEEFKARFIDFLKNTKLVEEGIVEKMAQVNIENDEAVVSEGMAIYGNKMVPIATMTYAEFLKELSSALHINLKTLHESFVATYKEKQQELNTYLNQSTIRLLKQKFDNYLMEKAINTFSIAYQKVQSAVHPTKLTDAQGQVKDEIDASDIGVLYADEKVADSYLLDALFYDSELEKYNIETNLTDVVVFTKIPKNAIKIPVAGGKTYSPDFSYVVNFNDGKKKMHFIVETKNTDEEGLRNEEEQKIKHAKEFFGNHTEIKFKTQFESHTIRKLIQEIHDKKTV